MAELAPSLRSRERSVTRWRNFQGGLASLQLMAMAFTDSLAIRGGLAAAIAFSVVVIVRMTQVLTDQRLALFMVNAPGLPPLFKRLNSVSAEHAALINAGSVIVAAGSLLLAVVIFIVQRE